MTTSCSLITIPMLCIALGAPTLYAADLSSYRGMHFGMNLATAGKQAGTNPTEARTVHQRPAVIQEMDWRPRPGVPANLLKGSPSKADPMREGLLCFFNGELFRIVVTYDSYKVEGMSADDMIEAISATYGAAARPAAEVAYNSIYGEVAPVLARWEDTEYSFNLVRSGDRSSFGLILYSKRLDALAQAAIADAVRLDTQEAPQREVEKQKKRAEEERLALEKSRSVNKPNFRP